MRMRKEKEKAEFYIKTLLALYRADEISLDKLWSLLKKELWDINAVMYDNIEWNNKKWNYDFTKWFHGYPHFKYFHNILPF